jgi:secondary thiamine-phosphate synthase enzyme
VQHQDRILVETGRKGLTEVTRHVREIVTASGVRIGLCVVFVRHTSASLVIQENADPSARHDLEAFFERLVPEGDRRFTHTSEGPDDMPSHIKAALTQSSLAIPITAGKLALGTWQGIYLWEHRSRGNDRELLVHVSGDA